MGYTRTVDCSWDAAEHEVDCVGRNANLVKMKEQATGQGVAASVKRHEEVKRGREFESICRTRTDVGIFT